MLDVNIQTQLLPQSAEAAEQGWRAVLGISELEPAFDARYGILTGATTTQASVAYRRARQTAIDDGCIR